MPHDLVIFDCDGVLIDSELIACATVAACLGEIGIPVTAEEIAGRYIGIGTPAMLLDLESRGGLSFPAEFSERLRWRTAAAFEAELVPMAGAETILAALTCKICVASSSTPQRLRHSLSLVGLLRYFDRHIFSASQVARGKPAPDLFLFAAEQMGVKPDSCVVIEDSVPGVAGATAAGMHVIGFTGGSHCKPGHPDLLRSAGAFATCADLGELPSLLRAAAAI